MMPDSDHPSLSSKERTPSQLATPALPPPEREKKPDKKLETPILVAMISASVTLITAILGSPLFLNLVNKPDTPASTSTAEIAISQSSLLPNNPTGGELFKAIFTPTESGTDILESTPTPQGENPTSAPPLLASASASATLPPEKPKPPTPAAPSIFQCISADLWFPYPGTLKPETGDGCLNLAGWGFSTDQDRLLLVPKPVQDQQRGIYTPISGDVDIRFSIQLNEFRTRLNKVGFLHFGIVQNDPFSIYKGGYLSYQQPTPGTDSPVRVLISGSNQATQKISVLDVGFQHDILLSIKDNLMTVYLNGKQTGDPVNLPRTRRAFWIGYVLPSKSELDVMITDFTIQTH
jgi:hypothetical protein